MFYLDELRKASWNGIPKQYRTQAWKLLCVYLIISLDFSSLIFDIVGLFTAES